ncbi:MAG: deoxyribodipyrimidine photolyase, partial [Chlamydiia bacterium]|nr:deoxyribodipyrimidine photolyase [Chlamydiia bacterium]
MILKTTMPPKPIIVWLRNDFRLCDHPALFYAAEKKRPLILLYIHTPPNETPHKLGGASSWWLHYSLEAFSK